MIHCTVFAIVIFCFSNATHQSHNHDYSYWNLRASIFFLFFGQNYRSLLKILARTHVPSCIHLRHHLHQWLAAESAIVLSWWEFSYRHFNLLSFLFVIALCGGGAGTVRMKLGQLQSLGRWQRHDGTSKRCQACIQYIDLWNQSIFSISICAIDRPMICIVHFHWMWLFPGVGQSDIRTTATPSGIGRDEVVTVDGGDVSETSRSPRGSGDEDLGVKWTTDLAEVLSVTPTSIESNPTKMERVSTDRGQTSSMEEQSKTEEELMTTMKRMNKGNDDIETSTSQVTVTRVMSMTSDVMTTKMEQVTGDVSETVTEDEVTLSSTSNTDVEVPEASQSDIRTTDDSSWRHGFSANEGTVYIDPGRNEV